MVGAAGVKAAQILVGLDLGQAQDHSAVAVVELFHGDAERGERDQFGELTGPFYICRGVDSLPLGTPYTEVAARTEVLLEQVERRLGPLRHNKPLLVLDATGVGRPVCEFFVHAGRSYTLVPTTITSGTKRSEEDGMVSLGKGMLVGALMAALGMQRLLLPSGEMGREIEHELHVYQRSLAKRSMSTITELFGSPARTGMHDDEVTALGLVVSYPPPPTPPSEAALNAFRNAKMTPSFYGISGGDLEWINAKRADGARQAWQLGDDGRFRQVF